MEQILDIETDYQKAISFPLATQENRLIAEFMDRTYHSKLDNVSHINELRYHLSWDDLMEVVEKISSIKLKSEAFSDNETYYPRTFGTINRETGKPMVRFNCHIVHEADTLKEATYLAVVDFIRWHNENS